MLLGKGRRPKELLRRAMHLLLGNPQRKWCSSTTPGSKMVLICRSEEIYQQFFRICIGSGGYGKGYMDPEYYMTQQLTKKSDVYSFGVVLLELMTARAPIQMVNSKDACKCDEIIDPTLGSGSKLSGLANYVDLTMSCVRESTGERPTMGEVVRGIENIMKSTSPDKKMDKGFSSCGFEETTDESPLHSHVVDMSYGLENGSSVSTLTNRFLESRSYYKAKSDYVRTAISRTGITCAIDMLKKQPKGYAIFDPYGGAMTRIGSDSIPYPHRKGNLFLIQYVIEWAAEDDAEREGYIDWIRRLYAAMAPYVSSAPRAAYVNYMDFDLGVMHGSVPSGDAVERARAWGEKYFLQNYDRLVRAKTAIDPSNE